jgi:predicted Fe-Mo cluster-binding NifX family protein
MKTVISTNGSDLDAPVSLIFGRCNSFLFLDTETMEASLVPNPAIGASGGAGIQAAQYVLQQGAQAVISGNLGPNAAEVFDAAGIPVYSVVGGTVREAVEALKAGTLSPLGAPTVAKDFGKTDADAGSEAGRNMGRGRGMGRGGSGMGRGRQA